MSAWWYVYFDLILCITYIFQWTHCPVKILPPTLSLTAFPPWETWPDNLEVPPDMVVELFRCWRCGSRRLMTTSYYCARHVQIWKKHYGNLIHSFQGNLRMITYKNHHFVYCEHPITHSDHLFITVIIVVVVVIKPRFIHQGVGSNRPA